MESIAFLETLLRALGRGWSARYGVIAPYGVFEAKDGPFNLCAATAEMWRNLCEIAGRNDLVDHPDFVDNTHRSKNLPELKRELNKAFATNVRDLMTEDPVLVTTDEDAEAVAKKIADKHHNHLPVVDADGRFAGMVTRADALAALVSE